MEDHITDDMPDDDLRGCCFMCSAPIEADNSCACMGGKGAARE